MLSVGAQPSTVTTHHPTHSPAHAHPRRYEVALPSSEARVHLAVGAQLGSVYMMGASAPAAQWDAASPLLREAARSFRIFPKKRN